jgi:hypothetical protein
MLPPSVRLAAEALRRATISEAVVSPALSISSRVMTCTGSAVSPSMRLIAEPVISMRCGASGALGLASQRQGGQRQEGGLDGQNASAGAGQGALAACCRHVAGHGIPPEAV